MKKLITILAIAITLASCTKDETNEPAGCNCDKVYYQSTSTYNPTTGAWIQRTPIKTGKIDYNFTNDCTRNGFSSYENIGSNTTTAIFRGYKIECK